MNNSFGGRLVEMRTSKIMTQAELERLSGLPATLVSHYENGERKPGLENIRALCKGLKCTATELLGF